MILESVAHDAFRALVNLSDSALLVPTFSESNFLTFIVSYIVVSAWAWVNNIIDSS